VNYFARKATSGAGYDLIVGTEECSKENFPICKIVWPADQVHYCGTWRIGCPELYVEISEEEALIYKISGGG
jgi:hypothetical protein